MRLLISFLMFSLWTVPLLSQAPPPGQTVKPSAHGSNNVEKQSSSNQPDTASASTTANARESRGDKTQREQEAYRVSNPIVVERFPVIEEHTGSRYDWLFNLLLVAVGAGQVWVVRDTLKAVREQGKLMHRSLVSQFRPRIELRYLRFVVEKNEQGVDCFWFKLTLVNIGGSRGEIVNSNVTFASALVQRLAPVPGYSEITDALGKIVLDAGERRVVSHMVSQKVARAMIDIQRDSMGGVSPDHSVFGYLDYRDDLGITRRSGFLREFIVLNHQCIRVEPIKPEYEYSD